MEIYSCLQLGFNSRLQSLFRIHPPGTMGVCIKKKKLQLCVWPVLMDQSPSTVCNECTNKKDKPMVSNTAAESKEQDEAGEKQHEKVETDCGHWLLLSRSEVTYCCGAWIIIHNYSAVVKTTLTKILTFRTQTQFVNTGKTEQDMKTRSLQRDIVQKDNLVDQKSTLTPWSSVASCGCFSSRGEVSPLLYNWLQIMDHLYSGLNRFSWYNRLHFQFRKKAVLITLFCGVNC